MFPRTVEEYAQEDRVARFAVDLIEAVDLSTVALDYSDRDSGFTPPPMMLAQLP